MGLRARTTSGVESYCRRLREKQKNRQKKMIWDRVLRRFECARVGLAIDLEQLRGVHVRVALRGAEARVTEKFLNRAQVGATLQQMCGERVPQGVRADASTCTACSDIAPHEAIDAPHGQSSPAIVHEKRIAASSLSCVLSAFSRPSTWLRAALRLSKGRTVTVRLPTFALCASAGPP